MTILEKITRLITPQLAFDRTQRQVKTIRLSSTTYATRLVNNPPHIHLAKNRENQYLAICCIWLFPREGLTERRNADAVLIILEPFLIQLREPLNSQKLKNHLPAYTTHLS